MMQTIFFMSEGTIGEAHSVLKKAAIRAIQKGTECITLDVLNALSWTKPSERKARPAFA